MDSVTILVADQPLVSVLKFMQCKMFSVGVSSGGGGGGVDVLPLQVVAQFIPIQFDN